MDRKREREKRFEIKSDMGKKEKKKTQNASPHPPFFLFCLTIMSILSPRHAEVQ